MRDKIKKILGIALAIACVGTTFAGCGGDVYKYKGDELGAGFDKSADVDSNGGFAVEKGDYVYFINGAENYTAENEYGEVVKGALMRIEKSALLEGDYSDVKTVVPSLFVAQNFDAGIYIYEDYVYYATPTTDKNIDGDVENSYIDFKRAKLDGSEGVMKDYYFRLADNAANYRFVQGENDVVYCLYEEDSALKSFNTQTRETTVLVSGAKSSFYFDTENAENANVYYTMGVTAELGATAESYDQIYCVNAASTAKVDAENAGYTVYDGEGNAIKTYSFDKADMEEANAEAKENETDEPYDFNDYTTYPYVNLGTLVLDGIGSNTVTETQYNWDTTTAKEDRGELDGYVYTINCYRNNALYFTRAAAGTKTSSDGTDAKMYTLADAFVVGAAQWSSVTGNELPAVVAPNTTNTASALFYQDGEKQYYIYVSNSNLMRAGYDNEKKAPIPAVTMAYGVGEITLWKLDADTDFLYYYAASGSGNNLTRIKYNGTEDSYNPLYRYEEAYADYQPTALAFVEWNSSWYKPELFGDTVLYSNAQAFGASTTNQYIYAAKMGTAAEVKAINEAYEKVQDEIDEYSDSADVQTAMKYFFRTGATGDNSAFEAVRDEYSDSQQEAYDNFVALFADGEALAGLVESNFVQIVGKVSETDAEAIETAWADTLLQPEEETEDESLPTWAIVLIVCGSVVIVAAAAITVLVVLNKKKKAAKAEAEATVNAYKRKKIDTTDDKTIDVYADETTETTETVEEETTVEEVVEEAVEETVAETEATEETQENNE